jgi:hypothetical protein
MKPPRRMSLNLWTRNNVLEKTKNDEEEEEEEEEKREVSWNFIHDWAVARTRGWSVYLSAPSWVCNHNQRVCTYNGESLSLSLQREPVRSKNEEKCHEWMYGLKREGRKAFLYIASIFGTGGRSVSPFGRMIDSSPSISCVCLVDTNAPPSSFFYNSISNSGYLFWWNMACALH